METDREMILNSLHHIFPDGVIYRDAFNSKTIGELMGSKEAGRSLHRMVSKLARAKEQSSIQWLQENGFIWRETGYVEKDMLLRECEFKRDSAVALADSVFRIYPLAGQYSPTGEEMEMLFSAAQRAFQRMCVEDASLTRAEALVLTLSTIELLKNWSSDVLEDTGTGSFWNYIYLQYGFNPENSQIAEQRVYNRFRAAIQGTLVHYKRYLAPSKTTHRYYTSLLLHALAPKESIENLLDILFDFYVKNLDFQYEDDDVSYKTLVKGMQARWKEGAKTEEAIKLRSSEVMSGLKTLFQERPGYMAVTCDDMVRKIDQIIRGQPFTPEDRWDALLLDWYRKKSSAERASLQGQKREHRTEFVATSAERIFMQYAMENGKAGVVVPRIRLLEVGDSRPELSLYQGTREIYRTCLSVTGNDLALTTRRCFVPLEDTAFDFTQPVQICGEIEYLGERLFSSGKNLYREFICFDPSGNERTVKSGILYLFANQTQEVAFLKDSDVYMEEHKGQLYRVNLSEVGTITVDGKEIFADKQNKGQLRLYPSIQAVKGITANAEGKRFHIFHRDFRLRLRFPEKENPLRYQLIIDGKRCAQIEDESEENSFTIDPTPGSLHIVRVADLVQNLTVIEYCYLILPGFQYQLDKSLYLETEDRAQLYLRTVQTNAELMAARIPGTDLAAAPSLSGGYSYEVELPTAWCSLDEESAFRLSPHIWHGDIEKTAFSSLRLPNGWSGTVMLGGFPVSAVDGSRFEIGNMIGSGKSFSPEEPLWLSLTSAQGEKKRILFTWVVFEPKFTESPVEYRENTLSWQPEGRFLGESESQFRIMISGKREELFSGDEHSCSLCSLTDWPHGRYVCQVYQKTKALFSREPEKLVWESELIVGDENELRFTGQSLVLKNAIYWELESDELKNMDMPSTAGILKQIAYVGNSVPSGESLALPEYKAVLFFETATGRQVPYNSNEADREYEWINPVRLWIVNERRLILHAVTDDAVYFDVRYASILNRNPDRVMNRTAQKNRLKNPDYFEYEARKK